MKGGRISARVFIPPNGFTGAGQQTQAAQLTGMRMPRATNGTRRKRKSAAVRAPARRAMAKASRRANGKKGGKFVKGSAAAKRHMAKLRRMRKR